MIKKAFNVTLVFAIILTMLAPAALAATDDSRQFHFALTAVSDDHPEPSASIVIEPEDEITVYLTLIRLDAPGDTYPIYAMQDEIVYDSTLFELVGTPKYSDEAAGFSSITVLDTAKPGYKYVLMSFVSSERDGNQYPATLSVGSFTLRAKAVGTTEIKNTRYTMGTTGGMNTYLSTAQDISVTISSGEPVAEFPISLASVTGGTISASPSGTATAGTTVELTASPYAGYTFGGWTVTDASNAAVAVSNPQSATGASFIMPESAVTVSATFNARQPVTPDGDPGYSGGGVISNTPDNSIDLGENETPLTGPQSQRFNDVPQDHWAYVYIEFLAQLGFVSGKTSDMFFPSDTITRAEFVTILARMSGDALPDGEGSGFTDVDPAQYYAPAVKWAVDAGITNGTSETTFSPNDRIRREDIATMIVRYAAYMGYDFAGVNQPADFTDSGQIAEYADYAVSLMQQANILGGYEDGSFRPKGFATRAEVAKMLALVYNSTHPSDG